MRYLCACAIPDQPPDCTWMRPRRCHAGAIWESAHSLTLSSQYLPLGNCVENSRREGKKCLSWGLYDINLPSLRNKEKEKSILKDAFVEVTFTDRHHIPEREKKSLKHRQERGRGGVGETRWIYGKDSCILQKGAAFSIRTAVFHRSTVTTGHLQFKHGAHTAAPAQIYTAFTHITYITHKKMKPIHHHKTIRWVFPRLWSRNGRFGTFKKRTKAQKC